MVSTLIDADGNVSVALPAAVGSNPASPPALACYTTDVPANGVWLSVSDGWSATTAYCGIVFSGGVWNVVHLQGTPGWTAAWVVTY